jgi:hypothetical protein
MELTRLKGNTLKLYLTLVAQADEQCLCLRSHRALSQMAELARDTTTRALQQLEQHRLIVPQDKGWQVDVAPLEHLMAVVSGLKTGPLQEGDGLEIGPEVVTNGLIIGPVGQGNGPENRPNTPSLNARVRTLWSSSSEEDKEIVPLSSSPSAVLEKTEEEGDGNNNLQNAFMTKIKSQWDRIDSYKRAYPEAWFVKLSGEFGMEIPLIVLQQFILSGRTLADLNQPGAYQSYFTTCCRNAPPPVSEAYDADEYEGDLEAMYIADHEKLQAEFAQEREDYYREEGRAV